MRTEIFTSLIFYLTISIATAADTPPVFERYSPAQAPATTSDDKKPVDTKQVASIPSQSTKTIIPPIAVPTEIVTQPKSEYKKFNINTGKKSKKSKTKKHVPVPSVTAKKIEDTNKDTDNKPSTDKKDTDTPKKERDEIVESLQTKIKELKDSRVLALIDRENTQTAVDAIKQQGKILYVYSSGLSYQIWTKLYMLTDIELQPGETINDVSGGDTERWVVDKSESGSPSGQTQWHVNIRPMQDGIASNLVIYTNKHTYHLKVNCTTNTYNVCVRWTYPIEEGNKIMAIKKEEKRIEDQNITPQAVAPDNLNFNYKIKSNTGVFSDDYKWTPRRVFDDGNKTYIQVNENMDKTESPALFIKDKNGNLNLVNYRLKDNYFIVDRLFDEVEMRNGTDEIVAIKKK